MEQVQPVINKDEKVVSIGAFLEMNTQFPSPLQLLYMGNTFVRLDLEFSLNV